MDSNIILYSALTLSAMGLLFGLGLGFAGVKFKVEEDERLPLLLDALPGANCGGCGYAGCAALAEAILRGEAKPTSCPVGGETCAMEIATIMEVSADMGLKHVAFIKCNGDCDKSESKYEYYGMKDCNAAVHLAGRGMKSCSYACIGGGSCLQACAFGAIDMIGGIAVVNIEKCTACAACLKACPKSLIELIPYKAGVKVVCNSKDNGKVVRGNCKVGCIACKICEKACNFDAVHVEDMLAKVDYDKCTECNECVKKCPMSTITSRDYVKETVVSKIDAGVVNTKDISE